MIKKVQILIFTILLFSNLINAQITNNEILKASDNFISENSILKGFSHKSEVVDLYSEKELVAYLIQLKPEGYIIFTSSKNISPIFSYSETGNFNIKEALSNSVFKSFLNNIRKQIEIAKTQSVKHADIIKKNNKTWQNLITENKTKNTKFDYQYGSYLTDIWGGVNCWDNEGNFIYPSSYFIPNHYSPGCVAISASQILNYYKWPPVGVGSHTDYDNNGNSQSSYSASFGSTLYDWDNMLNDYQGEYSTDTEQRAVGRLMYHVAVAVDMDFENEGSTSHANRVPNAFQDYFRTNGHYQTSSWSEFGSRLRENLENGMPVQFGIMSDGGDQHACVCDGYKYYEGGTKYYHLNMGWWNWYGGNAWYNIFEEFNAVGYSIITGGVFDILPKPMMNKVVRTEDCHQFTVNWNVSENLKWDAFELQESYNNGTWTTIDNNIADTLYLRTVTADGIYKYRVQTKVGGAFYADNYSNTGVVQVGKTSFLDFDGDDSFFVNDSYDKLDVSDKWTYEAWVKVNSYNSSDWSVIMDRRGSFSLYLLDDTDADFAVRFVTRDGNDQIVESLRSDNSDLNLEFGKWFHVAVSYDGTDAKLFLNGNVIEESNDASFTFASSTNALNVGARYWGSYSRYLNGQIDEIKISDTARYTEEFCPDRYEVLTADKNTRLLLNFQYGTGAALYDASHNFLFVGLRDAPNLANWQTEVTPIVNINPISQTACSGSVSFELNTSNTDNYQWQINNGTGYSNLTDDGNISGSTTNVLNINDVSSFGEDNRILCVLSNSTVPHTCSHDAMFSIYGNCTIWDGTSWSNGLPNATKSAIINADYTANDFITTDNLTISESAILTISENYTLKVEGDFMNKGTLILESQNAEEIPGTFIHNGSIINYGNFIAQKKFETPNTEITENSYLFSNPINSSIQIANAFNNAPNVYENGGNVSSWNLLSPEDNIKNNKAYLFQSNEDDLISLEGNLNTGIKNKELKQLGNDDLFSFISNPYPSYINWNSETGWNKQNIAPNLYTFDLFNNGNSFNYSVWDGTVGLHSGNGYIKPMDAFFVYMTDFRSNLQLNNDARVSTENINATTSIPENLIRFKFETEDETVYDESVIYFGDTENTCLKVLPLSENKHYTFIPSSGKKYAIKRLVNPNLDTLVSVGFKTSQGGQIRLKVTEFTFDDATQVQLKDLRTGHYQMLEEGSTYTFIASASEPDNRFKLYFGDYVVSVKDVENNNSIKAWSSKDNIFIKNLSSENISYHLYDISGKLISEGNSNKELTTIKNIKTGIKIIKLISPNFSKTYKLIIIK